MVTASLDSRDMTDFVDGTGNPERRTACAEVAIEAQR
ncbi:Dyp-type peroxidase [Vibrio lentus]|nr:Dyp-type peroxidase [Vibrio lentus]